MLYVERSLCVFTLHVSNENGCAGRSEVNLSSTRKFFSLKIGTWSRQRVTTLDAAMRSSHHYCRSENSLLFLAQATRYRPSFQLSHVGGGLGSASFSARAVGGHASRRASLGRGARWIHRTLSCTMSTWNSASPRQAGEAPFPLGMQEGLVGLSITASKKTRRHLPWWLLRPEILPIAIGLVGILSGTRERGPCCENCIILLCFFLTAATISKKTTPMRVAKLQDGSRGHFSCFWSCFSFCSADCHSNSVLFLRPPMQIQASTKHLRKKKDLSTKTVGTWTS